MIRRTLLLAGLLVVALAVPARAQPYAEGVTVSDAALEPGEAVTLSACCFLPGSEVVFSITSDALNPDVRGTVVLGTDLADQAGVATGTFTLPENIGPGPATITATGTGIDGEPLTYSTTVMIAGEPAPPDGMPTPGPTAVVTTPRPGALPVTGSDGALPLSLIAAALLGTGGLAVLAGRRRRTAAHDDAHS
jgi:LPXTG-motif cell wall-anchored protein